MKQIPFLRQVQRLPLLLLLLLTAVTGCTVPLPGIDPPLPTLEMIAAMPTAAAVYLSPTPSRTVPPTWTPDQFSTRQPTETPTRAPLSATETRGPLPTRTPFPSATPTASITPFPTRTPTPAPTTEPYYDWENAEVKPLGSYAIDEIIPIPAFPRPANDNGWGMHWIPTVSQERAVVDRFVAEVDRMHIKWVVILNDGTNIGSNDYLVEQLTARGIMPIMRLYRSGVLPYDGDIGRLVRHYRAKGVYYYQLYNEPNINIENHQGFANPNQYAEEWSRAAREVVLNGGLPGIGALSPGGQYNHYEFLDRTLTAIEWNGDGWLLNRTWLSIHNYHGLRPLDDPDGFLMFRKYNEIVEGRLGRPLPMIGTEGGSYSPDPYVERDMLIYQYTYMRDAEPYLFAFSDWLLASNLGGAADPSWEWQTLFRQNYVHPVVTDFFYQNQR